LDKFSIAMAEGSSLYAPEGSRSETINATEITASQILLATVRVFMGLLLLLNPTGFGQSVLIVVLHHSLFSIDNRHFLKELDGLTDTKMKYRYSPLTIESPVIGTSTGMDVPAASVEDLFPSFSGVSPVFARIILRLEYGERVQRDSM